MGRERRWHGARGDAEPEPIDGIRAARLVDGSGGQLMDDALIRVEGEVISWCGPAASDPRSGEGNIVDLGDRTVMPGLIDCHAHPGFYPQVPDEPPQAAWSGERRVMEAAAAAARALMSGVTTMRIPGLPGMTSYALRDAIDRGVALGPRVIIAGRVICPTGGHGHAGGEEADGPVGVRRAARRLFKEGADFLKLTATGGGTAGTVRHRATLTVDELAAAADEAEHHSSYATAHVHGLEGIERCLDAGVQMLEHATFVGDDGLEHFDRDLAQRIRDRDVPVVPTVQVNGRIVERDDLDGFLDGLDEPERRTWDRRIESFRRRVELVGQLHDAGVTILMGSDGGGRPAAIDDLAYGLELHVRAGLDPMTVILSATSLAADRLGLGRRTGRVKQGLAADLIAMPGNPASDIRTVASTDFVMARGSLVRAPSLEEHVAPGG